MRQRKSIQVNLPFEPTMQLVQRALGLMEYTIKQVEENPGKVRAESGPWAYRDLLGIPSLARADIEISVVPTTLGCTVQFSAEFPLLAWRPNTAGVSDFERMLKQLEKVYHYERDGQQSDSPHYDALSIKPRTTSRLRLALSSIKTRLKQL